MPSAVNSRINRSTSAAIALASRSSSSARGCGVGLDTDAVTSSNSRIRSRHRPTATTMSSTIRRTSGSICVACSGVKTLGSTVMVESCGSRRDRSRPAAVTFRLALLEPATATLLGRGIPADLVLGLRYETRDFHGTTVSIHRDHGEVATVRMPQPARDQILSVHANADLHRRAADVVHAGFHYDQVADMDRLPKIHAVHGRRNRRHPRMTERRYACGCVHHR